MLDEENMDCDLTDDEAKKALQGEGAFALIAVVILVLSLALISLGGYFN